MDEKKVREAIGCINDLIQLMPSVDRNAVKHLETAIEALEKQLPMKPTEVVGALHPRAYECKYCGNELESELLWGEYCMWCGQRIDWSEQS